MLLKKKTDFGKTLIKTKTHLVESPKDWYVRPPQKGREWFQTTTSIWKVDGSIKRRVRDWRRLTGEDGHSGERSLTFRKEHNSIYTGTYSVFPAPLVEWIYLRYGGPPGNRILDAFAGGPVRATVSSLMGYEYHGFEIRQSQIDENMERINELKLDNIHYHLGDARILDPTMEPFDFALTCPPYYNLEVYSDNPDDISTFKTYDEFDMAMLECAHSHFDLMKPDTFLCIVVGNFRDKKTHEMIDFRGDTVSNFRDAGFYFWQEVILSKNFASAAKRASNAWKGKKLVPCHEHLLVFRKPE